MWAYTLDVLNEQDLRERRDTIRFETVQRYDVGDYGWAYRDCFIIFDDVWQLTHFNARRTCLRVRLSGIEEHEPDPSFMMTDTILVKYGSMWGQAAAFEDKFIRVDGSQPFIAWYGANRVTPDSSFDVNIPELMKVVDPLTLRSEHLGVMKGAYTRYNHGHSSSACTTPDIDGDGIGEVLLYYHATSPVTGKQERLVDLFLTGDRPTTGVESSEQRAASTECDLSGDVVRIYNVLGEQIATLPLSTRGTIAPSDLEALPMQPLWAVSGKCVKRIR